MKNTECSFCHPPYQTIGDIYIKTAYDDKVSYHALCVKGTYKSIPIAFCPACGRHLEAKKNW